MKTAVETVFVGKDRQYNRRFLQMCSHYLVQPVACTPASGWEKGQVENQVGLVRERFFTPRLRFKSYEELNAWLLDKCIAYTKAHRHIDQPERTIWNVFEEERDKLVEYRGPFEGFHTVPASVSKTCTVRFDNNKYSVLSTAVGRPVEIKAYASRIVIRQDGILVAEHVRSFGRGETVYDPGHYVPVLARKPGALRNGAPFQEWVLPSAMERVRRRLKSSDDGDRQMVSILAAVLTDGIDAVEAACQEALDQNVCSSAVIINILARRRDPAPAITILTPDALRLQHEPLALKLYGMRGAYDEVMATGIKRQHEPPRIVVLHRITSDESREPHPAGPTIRCCRAHFQPLGARRSQLRLTADAHRSGDSDWCDAGGADGVVERVHQAPSRDAEVARAVKVCRRLMSTPALHSE
ncbi:transposase [Mesorhizobium sp. L2C085B000]|nr:transposase [Mesorhizobium sp. L2C085B000]